MFYFKDQKDGFYAVEDLSIRVPDGCVQITEDEAQSFMNKPEPDAQVEARAYLVNTDWYIVRFAETGVPIPDEIKAKRQEARALL